MKETALVPMERIQQRILLIRGQKVMLDYDLSRLYEVETRLLTRAVRRNIERFPSDFMFQLTPEEYKALRSQIGISDLRTGVRYRPMAFTEPGVAMLSKARPARVGHDSNDFWSVDFSWLCWIWGLPVFRQN